MDFWKVFGKDLEPPKSNKNGTSTNGHRYVFDEFEVDPANRVLTRAGQETPLTAKVFDVLLVFVQNPGRLLEKDELLEQVWQGNFVEEGNLARNVSTLRRALGDNGKEHRYIATVQGRGYRFLGAVKDGAGSIPAADETGSGTLTFFDHLNDRFWLASVGTIVLIGFALLFFQGGYSDVKPESNPAFENLRQTKLTQDGDVYVPAISRDGQYLAYVAIGENGQAIAVRQIGTGSALKIVPPQVGLQRWGVSIAPDNSFVYYVSVEEGTHSSLNRIPLFGGQPRKLADLVRGYALSPDGEHIAVIRADRQANTASIVVIKNDGSDARDIVSGEWDSHYYSIDWSPEGQNLLYSTRRFDGKDSYIAEIPAAGGVEKRINKPPDGRIFNIRWLPDKSGFIAVAVDESTDRPQLYYLSYPDGVFTRITNDVSGHDRFTMTGDGRIIVTDQAYDTRQIWRVSTRRSDEPLRILGGTEKHFDSVDWAGDEYLIFDEDANGTYGDRNIWRMRPDGSEREQLTTGIGNNTQPTVSPDGKTIVFVSERSGKSQLWRMDTDGNYQTQITDIDYNISFPSYSQDGQTIYFAAWVNSEDQIWRTSINGGEATPVIQTDVHEWGVSPDGSQLVYASLDKETGKVQTRLRRLDRDGPDASLQFIPETWMLWSRDGKAIYFNTSMDGVRNVWRYDLGNSESKPITDFADERIFDCAWSADETDLACVRQKITFDAIMIRLD